ncbi:hypothetical protein [Gemmatimonas sp.]|uniref:hypothetical protein n=1 Tax=Gemmatimonas sp. TaxID=1962908 RepID=UPI003DA6698C
MPLRRFIPSLVALTMLSTPSLKAAAQRRPGVGMGFYTTTGLLSADVEVGPVTSTTALAEAPLASASLLLTAPLKKGAKRAWIAGARFTPLAVGNGNSCFVTPDVTGCQDVRFEERAALLAGGAFRHSLHRVARHGGLHALPRARAGGAPGHHDSARLRRPAPARLDAHSLLYAHLPRQPTRRGRGDEHAWHWVPLGAEKVATGPARSGARCLLGRGGAPAP